MEDRPRRPAHSTHTVSNQPPPLTGINLFTSDRALSEALPREGAAWATEQATRFGARINEEPQLWAVQANENSPTLKTHDRYGRRVDEVEFHPAWHSLMKLSVSEGLHALPWREPKPGAHVARAALFFLMAQVEAGHGCPLSMTYSGVPALRVQPDLAAEWEPRLTSLEYDPRQLSAQHKKGALCGMAMTEKQGGSDVRANTTTAVPLGAGGPGGEYEITGHKWFCSAPMNDAFLMLAQAPRGLSCFLVPRWLPDGTRNHIFVQRLKDKLGNRSNASSEIELDAAWGRMIGEEGRGVPTIIEMVSHTRLDCVIGSAAGMRLGVLQATHHAAHRSAFGKVLHEQPLMQNVLADLAVESEAATLLMARLARAYDEAPHNESQRHFARLATAVAKFWICKRAPSHAAESLECFGGSGYVEESNMPRLFRESPLNSIWEGSGNVICLDVLRAMKREPSSVEALVAELRLAKGEPRLDSFVAGLLREFDDLDGLETRARRLVEKLALALQASLLVRFGDPAVTGAFLSSRLQGEGGLVFGSLPRSADTRAIVARATPRF
jgi:putative acyl-CoA dehydrogenase